MLTNSTAGQLPDPPPNKLDANEPQRSDPRIAAEMGILFREIRLPSFVRPLLQPFELREAQHDFQTLRAEELDKLEKQSEESKKSGKVAPQDSPELESPKPSVHGIFKALGEVFKLGKAVSPWLCITSLGVTALTSAQGVVIGTSIKNISEALYAPTNDVLAASKWQPDPASASLWGAILIGIACTSIFSSAILEKLQEKFGWKLFAHLEARFLEANASREFGKLHDEEVNRNLQELKENRFRLQTFFWQTLSGVGAGISLGAAAWVLTEYSWPCTVLLIAALAPRIATEFFSSHLVDYFERSQMRKWQEVNGKRDALTASSEIRDLQVMHSVPWGLAEAKKGMADLMARRFRLIDQTFWRRVAANSPMYVGGIVMFGGLVQSAVAKHASIAQLAEGSGAVLGVVMSGLALSGAWGGLLAQSGYAKRILKSINTINNSPLTQQKAARNSLNTLVNEPLELSIDGIEISNQGDIDRPYRLKIEKLVIGAGEFFGVVGKRGAGKTTLLKTLLKEIEPERGNITLSFPDGSSRSLQDLTPDEWHHHINCLSQDAPEFRGLSVKDAICLGHTVDKKDIWQIMQVTGLCEIASADSRASDKSSSEPSYDTVKLDKFLQTRIGSTVPGGRDFSGGEMRLIALTRILLHPQPIVILDEPGESLDPDTERGMIQRVRDFCTDAGRTLIVVSHRYGTLIDADKILVLHNGQICNSGSHKELLSLQGRKVNDFYAEAYKTQLKSLLPGFEISLADNGAVGIREI